MQPLPPLPIDSLLPAIARSVHDTGCVVITAEPGAGKTTRVPLALANAQLGPGQVVVTEPRRLAARLAARYVSSQLQTPVGGRIGYTVRFDNQSGDNTVVRYVTEGVLLRQLLADPHLSGVRTVVLDEVHERHLATDELLALLTSLRARRPELSLVVMSATLDPGPVQQYLGECVHLHAAGQTFPLEVSHARSEDDRVLSRQVQSAIRTALRDHDEGDILVFLPGAPEVRQQQELMQQAQLGVEVCPLYGELPLEAQAKAIAVGPRRRVVLATNVAESSVTVEGVRIVIDSGLAKVASVSPWSGRSMLRTQPISKNSATQRAGRAARQGPGFVYRVYTERQYRSFAEHDPPEIERASLSGLLLDMAALGIRDLNTLSWLSPPPLPAVRAARQHLRQLGALSDSNHLTAIGQRMLECPLSPRLARVLVAATDLGVFDDGALAVALLAERVIRRQDFRGSDLPTEGSDLTERIDRVRECDFGRYATGPGVERSRIASVRRLYEQLRRQFRRVHLKAASLPTTDRLLGQALLLAFSDRVARRKRDGSSELVLKDGSIARLSHTSVVRTAPLVLALEVEDHPTGRTSTPSIRLACSIEADWLLDSFSHELSEEHELAFDLDKERVESVSRLMYGSVTLDESRLIAQPSSEAAELLYAYATTRKTQLFGKRSDVESLRNRLLLLQQYLSDLGLPPAERFEDESLLRMACEGQVAYRELTLIDWPALILAQLDQTQLHALRVHTPERVQLRPDLALPIHYERSKPPWIEARIQDFFGHTTTPALIHGQVPLTLHLLAPNRRAVQVTSDLDSFWTRHYGDVRKELRRRYPKHHWPEDGRHAQAPAAGRLRPKPD